MTCNKEHRQAQIERRKFLKKQAKELFECGLTTSEIAKQLRIPESTARSVMNDVASELK